MLVRQQRPTLVPTGPELVREQVSTAASNIIPLGRRLNSCLRWLGKTRESSEADEAMAELATLLQLAAAPERVSEEFCESAVRARPVRNNWAGLTPSPLETAARHGVSARVFRLLLDCDAHFSRRRRRYINELALRVEKNKVPPREQGPSSRSTTSCTRENYSTRRNSRRKSREETEKTLSHCEARVRKSLREAQKACEAQLRKSLSERRRKHRAENTKLLCHAIEHGHAGVVRILLQAVRRGEIEVDMRKLRYWVPDSRDSSALTLALIFARHRGVEVGELSSSSSGGPEEGAAAETSGGGTTLNAPTSSSSRRSSGSKKKNSQFIEKGRKSGASRREDENIQVLKAVLDHAAKARGLFSAPSLVCSSLVCSSSSSSQTINSDQAAEVVASGTSAQRCAYSNYYAPDTSLLGIRAVCKFPLAEALESADILKSKTTEDDNEESSHLHHLPGPLVSLILRDFLGLRTQEELERALAPGRAGTENEEALARRQLAAEVEKRALEDDSSESCCAVGGF